MSTEVDYATRQVPAAQQPQHEARRLQLGEVCAASNCEDEKSRANVCRQTENQPLQGRLLSSCLCSALGVAWHVRRCNVSMEMPVCHIQTAPALHYLL